MEQLASGRTGLTLKLSQAEDLLRGMHRIANRITAGLISASLIVSSSIVLQIAGPGAVSGYTILALSGYVIAAVLGVYLLLSTLVRDSGDEKRAKVKSR
jgi:ubiquinone biosynthesis protein